MKVASRFGLPLSRLGPLEGVCAPLPHGVYTSRPDSLSEGAYIPKRVDEVKLRTERVFGGGNVFGPGWIPSSPKPLFDLGSGRFGDVLGGDLSDLGSGLWFTEESWVEMGVSEKPAAGLRGCGRSISGPGTSDMIELQACGNAILYSVRKDGIA